MNKQSQYTDLELEVIALKVVIDSTNSMVNRQILNFVGPQNKMQASFVDDPQQKLFYILLTDFLSKKTDDSLIPGKISCLETLEKILANPLITSESSIGTLKQSHDTFSAWLKHEVEASIWASSLDMQMLLRLTRQDIIYFAANMSKHHFGHLTDVIRRIYQQLDDQQRPRHDIIPALESIYGELSDNILNYHGSTIAEMLNNLRWGVHDYLLPEFNRAYQRVDDIRYDFDIPSDIKTDFAVSCYWDLMNSVRSKPYVNRFKTTEYLKGRY